MFDFEAIIRELFEDERVVQLWRTHRLHQRTFDPDEIRELCQQNGLQPNSKLEDNLQLLGRFYLEQTSKPSETKKTGPKPSQAQLALFVDVLKMELDKTSGPNIFASDADVMSHIRSDEILDVLPLEQQKLIANLTRNHPDSDRQKISHGRKIIRDYLSTVEGKVAVSKFSRELKLFNEFVRKVGQGFSS